MSDTHYHACSTCSQSFECELELGTCGSTCSGCSEKPNWENSCGFNMPGGFICTLVKGHGKEHIAHAGEGRIASRCPISSPTSSKYRKPATRGYFLCDSGWICRCGEYGNKEHSECPSCGRPKPTQDGHESGFDLAKVAAEEAATVQEVEVEKAEEKSWTCPNCSNDYSGAAPEDDHSQSCHIRSCNAELCDECSYVCDDCEHSVCEDHHYSCQCCSHSVCHYCRNNHGT